MQSVMIRWKRWTVFATTFILSVLIFHTVLISHLYNRGFGLDNVGDLQEDEDLLFNEFHSLIQSKILAEENSVTKELNEIPAISMTEIQHKKDQLTKKILNLFHLRHTTHMPEISFIEEKDICKRYDKAAKMSRTNITGVWSETFSCLKDDITLVTQCDANKVDRIIEMAKHWDGPMSIVIYIDKYDIVYFSTKIGADDNIMGRKNIDFHLVEKSGEFYPINLLRNLALKNSRTAFVLLVDVDFLPSKGLHRYIKLVLEMGLLQENKVLVIAAFEYPTEKDIQVFPQDKSDLILQLNQGHIKPVHWKWFPTMGPLDYPRWQKEAKPYKVKYKDGFEPYIVMERSKVPSYDQSFVSRFGDKNSHLMEVWAQGFEFVVLPDPFLIHYPHPVSKNVPYYHCAEQTKLKFVEQLKRKYNIEKIP